MAKKSIGLIIGLGGPPHKEPDGDEGMGMGSMRKHKEECVREFFEAGAKKDWRAAAEAFQACFDLCEASEDHDEEDEDEADAESDESGAESDMEEEGYAPGGED